MERESLIEVEQITRYYGEQLAANNVSFTVNRGDILGFLGPNGAGKTTTMEIISGVLAASSGRVRVAGHDITAAARQAKQHIGFLPEHPPLYPDLCVDEYLFYSAKLRRIKPGKMTEAVAESKARCGLEDVGKRLINNLSKGYQQRVGIAQAIIHTPSVIILDEPTSGLDPIQILEIRELIRELGKDHSVILSTHILHEVQSVCNRVLIINEGKLVLDQDLNHLHENSSQTKHIRIALNTPPGIEKLLAVDGVEKVEMVDDRHFILMYRSENDIADNIVQQSVACDWGLFELTPEGDSLEATFMRLTRGEAPAQGNEEESKIP
ncbi:MAG: ATP-binding cassette domain-containing protein [Gammaproteobacteria bacterium]